MKIFLASRSPRRRELLEQINVEYELVDVEIDENWDGKEVAEDYVCRIAREKAETAYQQTDKSMSLVSADTAVVLDDEILGKAESADDAKEMLKRLAGKTHSVLSAVTVINETPRTLLNTSRVTFRPIEAEEIEAYCKTDEPLGKAGGYAIQGKAAVFIEKLEGSYSGVMGLPLYETYELLAPLRKLRLQ